MLQSHLLPSISNAAGAGELAHKAMQLFAHEHGVLGRDGYWYAAPAPALSGAELRALQRQLPSSHALMVLLGQAVPTRTDGLRHAELLFQQKLAAAYQPLTGVPMPALPIEEPQPPAGLPLAWLAVNGSAPAADAPVAAEMPVSRQGATGCRVTIFYNSSLEDLSGAGWQRGFVGQQRTAEEHDVWFASLLSDSEAVVERTNLTAGPVAWHDESGKALCITAPPQWPEDQAAVPCLQQTQQLPDLQADGTIITAPAEASLQPLPRPQPQPQLQPARAADTGATSPQPHAHPYPTPAGAVGAAGLLQPSAPVSRKRLATATPSASPASVDAAPPAAAASVRVDRDHKSRKQLNESLHHAALGAPALPGPAGGHLAAPTGTAVGSDNSAEQQPSAPPAAAVPVPMPTASPAAATSEGTAATPTTGSPQLTLQQWVHDTAAALGALAGPAYDPAKLDVLSFTLEQLASRGTGPDSDLMQFLKQFVGSLSNDPNVLLQSSLVMLDAVARLQLVR